MNLYYIYENKNKKRYDGLRVIATEPAIVPTHHNSIQKLNFLYQPYISDIKIPVNYISAGDFATSMAATCYFLRDALQYAEFEHYGDIGIDLSGFVNVDNVYESFVIIYNEIEEYLNDKQSNLIITLIVNKFVFDCIYSNEEIKKKLGNRFDIDFISKSLYENEDENAMGHNGLYYDDMEPRLGAFLENLTDKALKEGAIQSKEDFIEKIAISETMYNDIVDGYIPYLSDDLLYKIEDALNLSSVERDRLWLYSGRIDNSVHILYPNMLKKLAQEKIYGNDEFSLERKALSIEQIPDREVLIDMAIEMGLDESEIESLWTSAGYILTNTDIAHILMQNCIGNNTGEYKTTKEEVSHWFDINSKN